MATWPMTGTAFLFCSCDVRVWISRKEAEEQREREEANLQTAQFLTLQRSLSD